jgi:hypothetical protein
LDEDGNREYVVIPIRGMPQWRGWRWNKKPQKNVWYVVSGMALKKLTPKNYQWLEWGNPKKK